MNNNPVEIHNYCNCGTIPRLSAVADIGVRGEETGLVYSAVAGEAGDCIEEEIDPLPIAGDGVGKM